MNLCDCGCGEEVRRPENRFIHGHNRRGKRPWNKYLSKETDARVAAQAFALRGRSKETDPSLARSSRKHKGRTKFTHPGPAKVSVKLTGRTAKDYDYIAQARAKAVITMTGRTKQTHPGNASQAAKLSALWHDPVWLAGRATTNGNESIRHAELKADIATFLTSLGFYITTERWVKIDKYLYRVDVWGIRNDKKVIVEIGGCYKEKLDNLRQYASVFHIRYEKVEEDIEAFKEAGVRMLA